MSLRPVSPAAPSDSSADGPASSPSPDAAPTPAARRTGGRNARPRRRLPLSPRQSDVPRANGPGPAPRRRSRPAIRPPATPPTADPASSGGAPVAAHGPPDTPPAAASARPATPMPAIERGCRGGGHPLPAQIQPTIHPDRDQHADQQGDGQEQQPEATRRVRIGGGGEQRDRRQLDRRRPERRIARGAEGEAGAAEISHAGDRGIGQERQREQGQREPVAARLGRSAWRPRGRPGRTRPARRRRPARRQRSSGTRRPNLLAGRSAGTAARSGATSGATRCDGWPGRGSRPPPASTNGATVSLDLVGRNQRPGDQVDGRGIGHGQHKPVHGLHGPAADRPAAAGRGGNHQHRRSRSR